MKPYKTILIASLIIAGLTACGSNDKNVEKLKPDEELTLADSTARADAQTVMETPETSAEREKALMDISAKESRMRAQGYDRAANKYHETVTRILADSLGIIPKTGN